MRTCPAVRATVILLALHFAASARAQCEPGWLPGHGLRGADDRVHAVHRWDPDGAGPAPMRLVFGGDFHRIGAVQAAHVATWDPATGAWGRLGSGTNGDVHAFATAANGDLLVAGSFPSAGGVLVRSVGRWDGANWSPLGAGINGRVNDLAVLPNGDVVAVGAFTSSGAAPVARVARWNGFAWSPLAAGAPSELRTVAALPSGDIVVGGEFTSIGGVAANRIARWDGAAWHPLGSGVSGTIHASSTIAVADLALLPNGDLVAAGNFTNAGGVAASGVAAWNGVGWYSFAGGLTSFVGCVHVEASGDLLATAPAAYGAPAISRWNGASWSPATQALVGGGRVTTLPGGDVVAAGEFTVTGPGGDTLRHVARWTGTAWTELASAAAPWFAAALEPGVRGLAAEPDGTLYGVGPFQVVDGVPLGGVARFDGSAWAAVGSGVGIGSGPLPYPYPLAALATRDGDLVVGGYITSIDGAPAGHVVRWDGASWSVLGGGVGDTVQALTELANGDLVVGGAFTTAGGATARRVARWHGAAWHALGAGLDAPPGSLLALPDGDLLAAGAFPTGSSVVRWDGATWSPLGAGPGRPVTELRLLPDGSVVAVVAPPPPTNGWTVQRWDGAHWIQLGAPFDVTSVSGLVVLPDGDLLVSGWNYGGFAMRWDGAAWTGVPSTDEEFRCHAWLPDGDLVVGGWFDAAGPWLSPTVARLRSGCPATAAVAAPGCAGSGGANSLRATALPWVGATFRAAGTGLPTLALVSQVYGFAPLQLPLATFFPQALPGCDLLVTPDHVQFSLTTDGSAPTALEIPANAALVGVSFRHQLNLIELDAALQFVAITASDVLAMTVGAF